MKTKEKYLTIPEVINELKKRGIDIKRSTLYSWFERGDIPSSYYRVRKSLKRKFYYVKQDLIDFLIEKLG